MPTHRPIEDALMDDLRIITPPAADESDQLDHGLVALTEAIHQVDPDLIAHGCLGGMFGYGAHWDNDVFEMRPYYWGECDCGFSEKEDAFSEADPPHTDTCYQTELNIRRKQAKLSHWDGNEYRDGISEWSGPGRTLARQIYKDLCIKHGKTYPEGCAVHCTCGNDDRWQAWASENHHSSTCSLERPNFRHKPSGFEVRWYKWIGRDMQTVGTTPDMQAMFSECLRSLPTPPTDR